MVTRNTSAIPNTPIRQQPPSMGAPYGTNTTFSDYSLATIQVGGEAIPFMVSASPAILQHALTQMKETGFLYLYNGQESLAIRSDKVDAVKLIRMSTEG